mmetsp:Transcript_25693/g.32012  ORF Transcript_25693/g.32012 Transcript_25693/m.32012 type:complete len:84 (+) Transcript_25693:728-979(+)|eukprot:CAMPEP_0170454780 /NCGR_PEP_ID=MMETSP0123-20130129/2915_1 /TAXON_ID=182087 /ORGANISM="Favella ehrenbergii, Strain Fehren 1" /LENGTH=83 /DNA_ID=CAMNT_0010717601 /DNA_START=1006 /DNA_END=1257 /DNA_ORIENTATION=-
MGDQQKEDRPKELSYHAHSQSTAKAKGIEDKAIDGAADLQSQDVDPAATAPAKLLVFKPSKIKSVKSVVKSSSSKMNHSQEGT